MWIKLAHTVIKYRLVFIILLGSMTIFMGFHAADIELSYDFAKVVPASDPNRILFEKFRAQFGADDNTLVIGLNDPKIYTPDAFQKYKYFSDFISKIEGVEGVISLPSSYKIVKNKENKSFELQAFFDDIPNDSTALRKIFDEFFDQKFFEGQLYDQPYGASIMVVQLNNEFLRSKKRSKLFDQIVTLGGDPFEASTGIKLHYAGLPYLRTAMANQVEEELNLFLILSLIITASILLFFFRSWDAVVFPLMVIGVIVIWSMGTLVLFGFKITLLTGLIPPIITVIGIPNCIYLINKYHQEFNRHQNKIKAISCIIRKIGFVTLMTNVTTAIGFLVFAFTDIVILKEFGIVAGINILATFVVSILFIPAIFTYLPPPSGRKLKHLKFKLLDWILTKLDFIVHHKRYTVFMIATCISIVSIIGILQLYSISYMADDIPKESRIKKDIAFFEQYFKGVMPLEIMVDTGKKLGIRKQSELKKGQALISYLDSLEGLSTPLSVISFIKAAKQAYYNGNPKYYELPDRNEINYIYRYLKNQSGYSSFLNNYMDSLGRNYRISVKVADIGSKKMDTLLNQKIIPRVNEIFGEQNNKVQVTGSTLLFVKGNQFLIENLRVTLALAFCIIALLMGLLFRNIRMILISLVPNIIPLLMTAGIMGYFNIPLKPSTALIFSIVFGISVDDSIHFLAKYRQELFANNFFVPIALSKSIRETGTSMIYTSIILFAGFVIFSFSKFGGTVALGVLTSTTLLFAMLTNLVVLPSLLLHFDDGKRKKDPFALIEHYDEFYQEDEDEEIDLELLRVPAPSENGKTDKVDDVIIKK